MMFHTHNIIRNPPLKKAFLSLLKDTLTKSMENLLEQITERVMRWNQPLELVSCKIIIETKREGDPPLTFEITPGDKVPLNTHLGIPEPTCPYWNKMKELIEEARELIPVDNPAHKVLNDIYAQCEPLRIATVLLRSAIMTRVNSDRWGD